MNYITDDVKRGLLVMLTLAVFIVALQLTFGPENCESFDCYQAKMIACERATYVNQEPEASWGYNILGFNEDNECEVEVTLLSAKEGDLGLRAFEGNNMVCAYTRGILAYPEKNLDRCTGKLKENLQSTIIEKLYRHIIANLGQIQEGLNSF